MVDSIKPVGGVIVGVSIYESMKGADTALGLNLDADFSAWHQHFSQAFPYLGEHVELVESDKHYQTFGFAIDPGFESEGWADLIGWLQTYALEREFERYSTALNLQPGQLSAYFKRAACPASECAALLALSAQLHAPSPLTY